MRVLRSASRPPESRASAREPARFGGLPRTAALGRVLPCATTRRARLLGLAHLPAARAGHGLLIPRCRSVHTFGMRFCLDIHFLAADGRILQSHLGVGPRRILRCRVAEAVAELVA